MLGLRDERLTGLVQIDLNDHSHSYEGFDVPPNEMWPCERRYLCRSNHLWALMLALSRSRPSGKPMAALESSI